MAYRKGNRDQMMMFPPSIDDMIAEDDPARVYDAFVEGLNFEAMDFKMNESKVGNPEYDPKAMLKLMLYGYSYGERSSRRLERAVNHNIVFIWLSGGLKPDHITICRFRKRNKRVLKAVFKQCAKLCIKLQLIEGNTLFVDGSKMRANASLNHTVSKDKIQDYLHGIDQRINQLFNECQRADKHEEGMGSWVKLRDELNTTQKIKTQVQRALLEMDENNMNRINTTDSDCQIMRRKNGSLASYNTQVVVDDQHGLIVNSDVVSDCNDKNQFSQQINQANDQLATPCKTAVADAGYSNTRDQKEVLDQGIEVIVPNTTQAAHHPKKDSGFEKKYFAYDPDQNAYICPQGQLLKFSHYSPKKPNYHYRMGTPNHCLTCPHWGVCTTSREGRSILRLPDEPSKESLASAYASKRGQGIYKRRKATVELVFGHIKHNLRSGSFLLRGLEGVKTEMALLSTVFNIRRMISICGTKQLIHSLA